MTEKTKTNDEAKAAIKLFGERNTGTRYLQQLIERNLNVRLVPGTAPKWLRQLQTRDRIREALIDRYFDLTREFNLGWKHTRVAEPDSLERNYLIKRGVVLLSITKNPYSWLLSLYRRPYHRFYKKSRTFEEFLQTAWLPLSRDRLSGSLKNPMELWNEKNASYLPLASQFGGLNLTYESLITDPSDAINGISKLYTLEKKPAFFTDVIASTKDAGKDSAYYQDYYLDEKWRGLLSDTAIDIINREINHDLVARFGYEILPGSLP